MEPRARIQNIVGIWLQGKEQTRSTKLVALETELVSHVDGSVTEEGAF